VAIAAALHCKKKLYIHGISYLTHYTELIEMSPLIVHRKCKSQISIIKFQDRLTKENTAFVPVNWITYVLAFNCCSYGELIF
jgi:hypothetical protein